MRIEVLNIKRDLKPAEVLQCIAAELIYMSDEMIRKKKKTIKKTIHKGEDLDIKITM